MTGGNTSESTRSDSTSSPHQRLSEPWQQMLEVTPTLLEETDETTVGFVRIYFEFPAVQ